MEVHLVKVKKIQIKKSFSKSLQTCDIYSLKYHIGEIVICKHVCNTFLTGNCIQVHSGCLTM